MSASPPKLLIVDDEPNVVAILTHMVAHCGYEIRVAYDGDEAVAAAKDFHPDCVMTGIMMPRMDGVDEAKAILEFLPDCKFVVVSSNSHMQCFRDAFAALGVEERLLVEKPCTPKEIFDALELAGFPCNKRNSK
ncbi:MAG TPA: response regulator [Terriglobales bacterium]|nr:response regulator [Terriglobales bacterium]